MQYTSKYESPLGSIVLAADETVLTKKAEYVTLFTVNKLTVRKLTIGVMQ